jgi:serine/threonine protein kinase
MERPLPVIGVGSVLDGRYRLERLIARGGFAQVFLATHLRLRQPVAVKVLHPELLAEAAEHDFLARFEREAQTIAALDHPNILGVRDYGPVDGTAYLVMPYIEGGTLATRLHTGEPLRLHEMGAYLRQAAAALDYAHQRQIVHRDVKPQNMLLRAADDRLLLADFGIAKLVGEATTRSRTGTLGTLAYMAPEQFQGQVGPAADVYALGCVLFQLLTGDVPYAGATEQVIYGHLHAPVPSLAARSRGRVPAAAQPIIDRALAKDPAARFVGAGELARAFEATVHGAPTARLPPPGARATSPHAPRSPGAPPPAVAADEQAAVALAGPPSPRPAAGPRGPRGPLHAGVATRVFVRSSSLPGAPA